MKVPSSSAMPATANVIDLLFPVVGPRLPTDHGYLLYSAMSRVLPCLHDGSVNFAMASVNGAYVGNGLLQLDALRSRLRLRLAVEDVPRLLPLAGKGFAIMQHRIRLGAPEIRALEPAAALFARVVAIKNATDAAPFLEAARRQLDEIGVGGTVRVPEHLVKGRGVVPLRRVLRIKKVRIVGFALVVEGLSVEESLRLQAMGIGGRRRIGCGMFVPSNNEGTDHEA